MVDIAGEAEGELVGVTDPAEAPGSGVDVEEGEVNEGGVEFAAFCFFIVACNIARITLSLTPEFFRPINAEGETSNFVSLASMTVKSVSSSK
jgi:hypothetical protein